MFELQHVRITTCSNYKMFEFQNVRITKRSNYKIFKLQKVQITKFSNYKKFKLYRVWTNSPFLFPYVWSLLGPVPTLVVLPVPRRQSSWSIPLTFIQPQKGGLVFSNVHSTKKEFKFKTILIRIEQRHYCMCEVQYASSTKLSVCHSSQQGRIQVSYCKGDIVIRALASKLWMSQTLQS